jgi:hypothetical protein
MIREEHQLRPPTQGIRRSSEKSQVTAAAGKPRTSSLDALLLRVHGDAGSTGACVAGHVAWTQPRAEKASSGKRELRARHERQEGMDRRRWQQRGNCRRVRNVRCAAYPRESLGLFRRGPSSTRPSYFGAQEACFFFDSPRKAKFCLKLSTKSVEKDRYASANDNFTNLL